MKFSLFGAAVLFSLSLFAVRPAQCDLYKDLSQQTVDLLQLNTQANRAKSRTLKSKSPIKSVSVATLVDLAKKRYDLLVQAMKENPALVLQLDIPEPQRSTFPQSVQAYLPDRTKQTGPLQISHLDFVDPKTGESSGVFAYTLTNSKGEHYVLHFGQTPPMQLGSGTQVEIFGVVIPVASGKHTTNQVAIFSGAKPAYRTYIHPVTP